ncbi:MAG: hypothetical protein HOK52_14835 [Candidatus Marinimicrobia bacterium]|jgi:hypothetical protein|nr:hypothetical protein [Candidatus Neomarinimicrobiota bacterium]
MIRLYGAIALVMVILGLGLGCKYYYDSTQATIELLTADNATLSVAVEIQEATIAEINSSIELREEASAEIQDRLQESEVMLDTLRLKLTNHNLTKIAIKKPNLLEDRINSATKELFKNITADTTTQ